jgi:hypothetical protein
MPIPYDGKRIVRPRTRHNWTDETKKELLNCKKDLMYFAMKHVRVQTVDQGVTTLEFREYQERMFQTMLDKNRVAIRRHF